jgi:hypothetical protein
MRNLFRWISLIIVMLAGPSRAQWVADNSGTILASPSSPAFPPIDPPVRAALTLGDATYSSPLGIESTSMIESAPAEAPAFAFPLGVVGGLPQEQAGTILAEPDSLGLADPRVPIPEPATWGAGLLALAALLLPLSPRLWARQRTPLDP